MGFSRRSASSSRSSSMTCTNARAAAPSTRHGTVDGVDGFPKTSHQGVGRGIYEEECTVHPWARNSCSFVRHLGKRGGTAHIHGDGQTVAMVLVLQGHEGQIVRAGDCRRNRTPASSSARNATDLPEPDIPVMSAISSCMVQCVPVRHVVVGIQHFPACARVLEVCARRPACRPVLQCVPRPGRAGRYWWSCRHFVLKPRDGSGHRQQPGAGA